MKQKVLLQPARNTLANIIRCFEIGKPLDMDQLNFLDWHEGRLSSTDHDPLLNYYLKDRKAKRRRFASSFLLPYEEMNKEAIERFKKRLQAMLEEQKSKPAAVYLSQKQFDAFKRYNAESLIFLYGNQFLTGAPFILGGIPHTIFFQWGNLFGIVHYVSAPSERSQKSNLLIYFEELKDRTLEAAAKDYLAERPKILPALPHHTVSASPLILPEPASQTFHVAPSFRPYVKS